MILVNKNTFTSLHHRDFKCFIIGQSISLMGTWLQRTAEVWLLYTLTKSPLLLGSLSVFQFGPTLIFSVFSGAIVDRFPKKKLLYLTQTVGMLQALALFILVYTNHITAILIFILATIGGLSTTLDMPTRQSYFMELVGKKDLPNAVSLNSSIFNLAKIIGPSIAGIIMGKFGMSVCFFINFLSYAAVLTGLFFIKQKSYAANISSDNIFKEIKEGLKYIYENKILLKALIFMAIICTFAMNVDVIVPVFSKTVLHKGSHGYTFLLSSMGVGSLFGTMKMAGLRRKNLNFKLLKIVGFSSAIFQIVAAFSGNLYFTAVLVLGSGFSNLCFLNGSNSILQLNTSDKYRGRVMSIYTLLNAGTTPIGNLFVGAAMNNLGGPYGFLLAGIVTAFLTTVFSIAYRNNAANTVTQ
ncbi:MFS family permease [Clostridium acetobutylicum]|uniref:Permease n=1 Tax=Clostridium acetobutylicum (strain ATCC 824 / DSM 792 / JCM 1419 / IAM 19013 / LMG 5710 / NBRC 13948 / NRRL B-527 / VKM B-1787 / 2291 / W) TaxID=272562 RepID=Q97LU6_CLOAB|nr:MULTISPECIES: MFS transporter [Clostridium]AAK78438.1 Permease [Clostridium acetobutylicum ATCC 824]ADZ19508.1 Permease [Clostridium acetobutylicum EA 2018]AEI33758.1 permease [Clostridium acetobutylicum DSM 1731]AWV80160.1 MFS transporter [Clostridium acetobutylicum]MBC2392341.1 MFS transporter [Clostridium acetobutylicum]